MEGLQARVLLLCGPSGSGKSHLAARCGLPMVRLDDFYRDIDDPLLPHSEALGIVDWDDPRSWRDEDAVAALDLLCREGRAQARDEEERRDRRSGIGARTGVWGLPL